VKLLLRGAWLVAPLCLAVGLHAPPALLAEPSAASASGNTNQVYPIDLPTALRLASARNLDVQIARQRLDQAKANHTSAVEQFFPWITPGAGFNRHEGNIQAVDGTILDVDKQSYTAGVAFTAQVNVGDAIYKSLASKQLVHAAGHGLESQQQDSALFAAQGYYDLAKAKAVVDVIKDALKISQDYQKQIHDAVGIGIAFKGDELRVQVQTEQYQIALRRAQEQQRVVAARLAQLLHLDSTVELVPQAEDLAPITLVETNAALGSLVERALHARPELKQNQELVAAARDTKNGAVYGPLIPSLGAQAFVGGLGGGKNDSTGDFGHSQDYFVGLGWRIGPGGLFDVGRIRASSAQLETARLATDKVRDDIVRQVVEDRTRSQSLFDQLATSRQNLATAAELLRLTRERKQYGVGVVLEDIQAQQDLVRARSDYLNAVAEYDKAEFALNWVIGGMTDTPGGQTNAPPRD
jgi:outer membrane protein TolC